MAGKGRALNTAVKYGPVFYAAVRKYGPQLIEQARQQREPVEKVVQQRMARGSARKTALTHASTVVDGSVLQVFHKSESYWVVFSGEEPIGTHPRAPAPYAELLRHADLSTRLRPTDAGARVTHRRGRGVPRPFGGGPDVPRS